MSLEIRQKSNCKYDLLALGEVMLRLDPGETRIRTARSFRAWEGGGEYNVARGLKKCFQMRSTVVTALADNEIGHLIEDLIMQGGVDTSHIIWKPFDGLGKVVRNGLNFTERGFGLRGALGVSDRGHSAASQMMPDDIDWNYIFGKLGVRWFHTGGIFSGLSKSSASTTLEAIQTAKKFGTIVSYDLNYRPSLWKSNGGVEKAREINREIAQYVDVMIGNEEDFTACLGFEVKNGDLSQIDASAFQSMIESVVSAYPNFKVTATTLREVKTANLNDWSAIVWSNGKFYESKKYPNLEIFDRIGGGDSFASGLIYGLLSECGLQKSVDYGAAHGALAMTTPGDTSMASLAEVEKLVGGAGARVVR